MNREERMRVEAGAAWAELDSLIMRMRIEENSAQRELRSLGRRLPEVLVRWAKGTASREEVRAVKDRIAELRELLSDVPMILEKLESEKRERCFRQLQDAGMLSRERERYNLLKEKILDRFETSLVDDLRQCAKDIGEEEDCERFLACVPFPTPS